MCSSKIADFRIFDQFFIAWNLATLATSRGRNFNMRAGDLGRQLSLASTLIAAGIDTPVLKVKIDGFDTHEDQPWRHQRLLEDLGRAMSGFAQQMRKIGQWDNTLVLTYSEFGRRAVENSTRAALIMALQLHISWLAEASTAEFMARIPAFPSLLTAICSSRWITDLFMIGSYRNGLK